jgi:hypothetical protein
VAEILLHFFFDVISKKSKIKKTKTALSPAVSLRDHPHQSDFYNRYSKFVIFQVQKEKKRRVSTSRPMTDTLQQHVDLTSISSAS